MNNKLFNIISSMDTISIDSEIDKIIEDTLGISDYHILFVDASDEEYERKGISNDDLDYLLDSLSKLKDKLKSDTIFNKDIGFIKYSKNNDVIFIDVLFYDSYSDSYVPLLTITNDINKFLRLS